jgi:hypothetical protein
MALNSQNPRDLSFTVSQIALLASSLIELDPDFAADTQLLVDTIDGESSLLDTVDCIVNSALVLEAQALGIKDHMKALADRAARMQATADRIRNGIPAVMAALGTTSLKRATYTASIGKGRTSVEVIDVEQLADGLYKVSKVPDKAAIKALLESDQAVAGAKLVTGEPTFSLRTR